MYNPLRQWPTTLSSSNHVLACCDGMSIAVQWLMCSGLYVCACAASVLRCQGVHVRCSWASRVVLKVVEGHRGSSRVIEGHRGFIEHRGIETSRGLMLTARDSGQTRHRGSSLASSSIEPYIEPTSSLYVEPSRPGLSPMTAVLRPTRRRTRMRTRRR